MKGGAKTPLYWTSLAIVILAVALWGSVGQKGDNMVPWSTIFEKLPRSVSAYPLSRAEPTRGACEEDINRRAAIADYVGGKLQLRGAQNEAWQKIKHAADPVRAKMYDVCKLLPNNSSDSLTLPSMIEFLEIQLSAQIELVHAIAEPVRALYDMLSPDQRAILDHAPAQIL